MRGDLDSRCIAQAATQTPTRDLFVLDGATSFACHLLRPRIPAMYETSVNFGHRFNINRPTVALRRPKLRTFNSHDAWSAHLRSAPNRPRGACGARHDSERLIASGDPCRFPIPLSLDEAVTCRDARRPKLCPGESVPEFCHS
ncbi:hypothetical protein MHPYR_550010 [uncultured Mycobacterium sp.]|uniref:Uncharacterized protein n=1 Tax=uncultured Mycobacterium sp. TaxID=171292 RepID=A0A1Y5PQA1_9MYCO|nr:hypothetical protein MHPYR_550010 [uncultured Mycobacterium sp.]